MKCKKGIHNFKKIWSDKSDWEGDAVVVWCSDCGAIKVNRSFDGRVQEGYFLSTKFPRIAYNKNAYQ